MTKPTPKKTAPKAFYLGKQAEAERRYAKLDEIAAALKVNRSRLLQMIADGDFIVTRPTDKQAV